MTEDDVPQFVCAGKALPRRDRQAGHHDRRRAADDGGHAVVAVPLGRRIPPHGHAQCPAHAADPDRQLCHLAVDQDAPRRIARVFVVLIVHLPSPPRLLCAGATV